MSVTREPIHLATLSSGSRCGHGLGWFQKKCDLRGVDLYEIHALPVVAVDVARKQEDGLAAAQAGLCPHHGAAATLLAAPVASAHPAAGP